MFLRPAPNLRIVDPVLRDFLPAAGREVTPSPYWNRLLRNGDVTVVLAATAPQTSEPKPSRKPADQ